MNEQQLQAQIDLINAQIAALAANQLVQQKQGAMQLQNLNNSLAAFQAKLAAAQAAAPTQG